MAESGHPPSRPERERRSLWCGAGEGIPCPGAADDPNVVFSGEALSSLRQVPSYETEDPGPEEILGRARSDFGDFAATESEMSDQEGPTRLRDIVALVLAFMVVLGTTLLARSDTSPIDDARRSARSVALGPT
jgi:hypothetical protein